MFKVDKITCATEIDNIPRVKRTENFSLYLVGNHEPFEPNAQLFSFHIEILYLKKLINVGKMFLFVTILVPFCLISYLLHGPSIIYS